MPIPFPQSTSSVRALDTLPQCLFFFHGVVRPIESLALVSSFLHPELSSWMACSIHVNLSPTRPSATCIYRACFETIPCRSQTFCSGWHIDLWTAGPCAQSGRSLWHALHCEWRTSPWVVRLLTSKTRHGLRPLLLKHPIRLRQSRAEKHDAPQPCC